MITATTLFLIVCLLFTFTIIVVFEINKRRQLKKAGVTLSVETNESQRLLDPPTPSWKLPIIGHMHLLAGFKIPYQAFSDLGRRYGKVVKLQLGTVKCVVVNEQKNIREALVTKGHHFDSRPNFQRYQMLFSGNKENSLAFCDWSDRQKTRRDMLKAYTFPRAFTNKYFTLDALISHETDAMLREIQPDTATDFKPVILKRCARIFLRHFCTRSFEMDDKDFVEMVENFDEIFYEVNQGYAADFLPFLMPFHKKNMKRMSALTHKIRAFVEGKVIGDRYQNFGGASQPGDYVESLIKHVKGETGDQSFDWETALFALEDIIGGHSAVGNFLIKLFAFLVNEPEVQKKIQQEIDLVVGNEMNLSICDRNRMPYTEATIFEAIRLIASPIVPRVANQDSSIEGYKIEKGTVLFLNNYDLSMSETLWDSPDQFKPERFIKDGRLFKPDHFLPFGGGRRSCMGYKIVQLVSFGMLGSLLQRFTIGVTTENDSYEVPVGSLALKKDTFKFKFARR